MSRTITSPTATAAAKRFTKPGLLIQLDFSFVVRLSSRGDQTWNGLDWIGARVSGSLQENANANNTFTLTLGNSDLSLGALLLSEPTQGVSATVWEFYDGALAAGDPVKIFDGSVDAVSEISAATVTIQLSQLNFRTLQIPRRRITSQTGFNHLAAAGRIIKFGNSQITLTRAT